MVIKCHGLKPREGDVHFENENKNEKEIREGTSLNGSVSLHYNKTSLPLCGILDPLKLVMAICHQNGYFYG